MLNPLVQKYLGSVVRWALALLGGYLVKQGLLSSEDAEKTVLALATVLVPLVWSLIQKFVTQRETMTAAAMPKGTPFQEVKDAISKGHAASALTPATEEPTLTPRP